MTAPSRTAQFAKVHKVLKKHYKPAPANAGRTVIEHLIFACSLEDAPHEAAEEAFAALVHTFFDWNEVRVTSISELSEVMACLPDPRAAANRVKRVLQSVFEAAFSFDLEECRKKNIGTTADWLKKLDGTTPFTVAYVVQRALGGHAIPVDSGALAALRVLELIDDNDFEAGTVPGLERAVSKSKGVEFGALLHELGADYAANPYSSAVREVLLTINPECKDRLPKRRAKRAVQKPQKPSPQTDQPHKEPKEPKPEKPTGTKPSMKKSSPKKPTKTPSQKKASSRSAAPEKRASSAGLSKRKPR